MKKVEMYRVSIATDERLSEIGVAIKARDTFIKEYNREPTHIRLSPEAFYDLTVMPEMREYSIMDRCLGMKIETDYDLEAGEWQVCIEEVKAYACKYD